MDDDGPHVVVAYKSTLLSGVLTVVRESHHQCSVCDPPNMFLTHIQRISSYYLTFFQPPTTHTTETGTASRWETSNSNPLGPIKLSSQ
jgi:hypothetical protein